MDAVITGTHLSLTLYLSIEVPPLKLSREVLFALIAATYDVASASNTLTLTVP